MAGTTDPRASSFKADDFRSAIRFAMNMGLPEDSQEQATFRWTTKKTYDAADPAGVPFDFTAKPSKTVSHEDVQVPVSVQFVPQLTRGESGTPWGTIDSPKAILTILDEDYVEVVGADLVLLGKNTYTVDYVAPPEGLFDVTIYEIYCTAQDEN
jgi:hypothetical protein